MSMANTMIGAAIVGVAMNAIVGAVLPAPTGIQVHGLTYQAGYVTQDRTVLVDGEAFYAQWAASVVDAETGDTVPECAGNGAAPYPPGRKAARFSLADWTGNEDCTVSVLEPGRRYVLRAVWSWGEKSVSASQEFVP